MLSFVKMHGLGNDYLYVFGEPSSNATALSRMLSDRHFGIGADGMIYITPPTDPAADFGMRIFNADGSEALMCGNGIRCVGKYVYDRRLTGKTALVIETPAGNRQLILHPDPENPAQIKAVTVDMGHTSVGEPIMLDVGKEKIRLIEVSVGNHHAVVFTDDAQNFPMELLTSVSQHKQYPDGVNAECAQVLSAAAIRMRVWERGSGITLACGTGACAVCAAAVSQGFCLSDVPITVYLDGGIIQVKVFSNGQVCMTGEAVTVCEGTVHPDLLKRKT